MKFTFTLDDELLAEAKELTNIECTEKLVQFAIKSMKEYEAVRELLKLAGTEPGLRLTPRRRLEVE